MTTKKDKARDESTEAAVLGAALDSPGRPEQTSLPDMTVQLTAERALAGAKRDPVVEAFLHTERSRRPVRKQPRAAWAAELDAFRKAPR